MGAPANELPFASRLTELSAFVYAIRCYTGQGVDVAIWERDMDGNCRRFVYATGPLSLVPGRMEAPEEPEDPSMTRSERIRRRLEHSLSRESVVARWSQIFEDEGPLTESETKINEVEFLTAMNLAMQFSPGCSVIGTDAGFRVVANSAERSIDCDTAEGTGDPEVVFIAASGLFREAGIDELQGREFSI